MRNNKILLITVIVFFTSILSFAFFSNKIFNSNNPQNSQVDIIGEWYLESSPSDTMVFSTDGKVKTYEDSILQYNDNYIISNNCNGNISSDERLFLQITDSQDGTIDCFIINGINTNGSEVLSLIDDRGKTLIYHRL